MRQRYGIVDVGVLDDTEKWIQSFVVERAMKTLGPMTKLL